MELELGQKDSIEITNLFLYLNQLFIKKHCLNVDNLGDLAATFQIQVSPDCFLDYFHLGNFLLQRAKTLHEDESVIKKLYLLGNFILFCLMETDKARTDGAIKKYNEPEEPKADFFKGTKGFIKIQNSVQQIRKQADVIEKEDISTGKILRRTAMSLELVQSVQGIQPIQKDSTELLAEDPKSFIEKIFTSIAEFFGFIEKSPKKIGREKIGKFFKPISSLNRKPTKRKKNIIAQQPQPVQLHSIN